MKKPFLDANDIVKTCVAEKSEEVYLGSLNITDEMLPLLLKELDECGDNLKKL